MKNYSKAKTAMSIVRDIFGWVTVAYVLSLLTAYVMRGFLLMKTITVIYGLIAVARCLIPSGQRVLTRRFFKNMTLWRWYEMYRHSVHLSDKISKCDSHMELSFVDAAERILFKITCSPSNQALANVFGDFILAEIQDYPLSYGFEVVLKSESDEFWRK